jgi:hypothetical protein
MSKQRDEAAKRYEQEYTEYGFTCYAFEAGWDAAMAQLASANGSQADLNVTINVDKQESKVIIYDDETGGNVAENNKDNVKYEDSNLTLSNNVKYESLDEAAIMESIVANKTVNGKYSCQNLPHTEYGGCTKEDFERLNDFDGGKLAREALAKGGKE